ACNSKKINMLSAQKHYPLADYGDDDFPISGIPGGCKKYHELMMKQENIGFFDIDSKRESLKLYAFPKTYEIYQELSYASVENLILLEKTQGIEYTNQLYHYLKKATQKAQIERLLELVRLGTELPMFIRKVIVDKIWSYLYYFQYNDISVQYIRDEIYGIIFITKNIYKEVLQLCWQIFKEGKLPWCALEGTLSLWWRDYYDDREIYQDLMDSKGLHDWRGMRRPEDCLIKTGESLISLDGRGDAILDMVADRRRKGRYQRDLDCGKSEKEIIEDVLKELKKQEKEIWDNVDPREKTRKLKPMDVYAVIHADIVRFLNE
ncbi:MAG: hypothetical protein K2P23_03955, partial [Lachnospiraceae bacterium]|nr:hypothetical protein [Lachnospiraceae bacterium]